MVFSNSRLKDTLLAAVAIFCLFIFFNIIKYHFNVISYPYQIEQEEIGMVVSTDLLMKGINPYRFENQPMYINQYGIGYNLFVIPIYKIISAVNSQHKGNHMLSHRVASAVAIFFSLALVAFIMYSLKINIFLICMAILLQYTALCYYSPVIAKPDSLGLFLYLLSLFIPWRFRYSFYSVATGIIIAIVAFYTKVYFVSGILIIISYIFFFISKSKGVKYFFVFSIVFILAAIVMNYLFEAYFYDVVFLQYNYNRFIISPLLKKTLLFASWNIGLMIYLSLSAIIALYNYVNDVYSKTIDKPRISSLLKKLSINISDMDKPFFKEEAISVFSWGAVLMVCLLEARLGIQMTYYFGLFMPLLLISALKPKQGFFKLTYVLAALLTINIYTVYSYAFYLKIVPPDYFFRMDPSGRFNSKIGVNPAELEKLVALSNNALVSRLFSIMALNNGKTVYDTSHNNYMHDLTPVNAFVKYFFPKDFTELNETFIKDVNDKIRNKHFDLLILTMNTKKGDGKFFPDPWFLVDNTLFDNYRIYNNTYYYFVPALLDTVPFIILIPKE
ncbi:MAG: hypothetical protein H7844_12375 [Nitrospirae bacterium YQR-1]